MSHTFSDLEVAPKWDVPIVVDHESLPHVAALDPPTNTRNLSASTDTGASVQEEKTQVPSTTTKRRRRWRWITIGAIALGLAIIGAVLGGVLGTRQSGSTTSSPSSGSSSPLRILSSSKLSAVSWTDSQNVYYRAAFWQAANNDLMASVWNSTNSLWTVVNITRSGGIDTSNNNGQAFASPMAGTHLSATVRNVPWNSFGSVALFYLSTAGTVEQVLTSDSTGLSGWGACCLSSMDVKWPAATDSHLAAFTQTCAGPQCAGSWIWVVYQDATGNVKLLNESGWGTSPKTVVPSAQDAMNATGLAMTATGLQSSSNESSFEPHLFYDTSASQQEMVWKGWASAAVGSTAGPSNLPAGTALPQLSALAISPTNGDASLGLVDILLVSSAAKGSLYINHYSNSSASWTGGVTPKVGESSSVLGFFTAGALMSGSDHTRFLGITDTGIIRSYIVVTGEPSSWTFDSYVFFV